jgi:glucosamine--fructose-6-phosphate aminotransferase (isomerizing)
MARVLDLHAGPGLSRLEEAARALGEARRVVLTGMGSSYFACIPLHYYLCSRGVPALLVETAELLHYQAPALEDAAIVLVSRSGDTVEIDKLLKVIRERRVITIGVTSESESTLASQARHLIVVGHFPDELIAIQSYTSTMLALLLLGAAACREADADWRRALGAIPATVQAVAGRYVDDPEPWRCFFDSAGAVYLLARGASCASSLEGCLLFHEIARFPAISMSAGQFRHGPVEVVDARFRGLIFAPAGRSQELNVNLARDLALFGGQVRVIGPPHGEQRDGWLCSVPAVAELVAPLIEIVPVQAAAYHLALSRGLDPGEFRYAAPVALDEARFHR